MDMADKVYDLIIVGSGPAGLTAAVYAGRYLLDTMVIGELEGGTISEAHKVCNFPSYRSITGADFTSRLVDQVKNLGVKILQERVDDVEVGDPFRVTAGGSVYKARKVILATGNKRRKLGVRGESDLLGKGVSYCAICDAAFFRDRTVAVAGGGNSALTAALLLSEYASKVFIIYRKGEFLKAEPSWVKQVERNDKIESVFNSEIKEITGSNSVKGVTLTSGREISLDGVFIEVGSLPNTDLAKKVGIRLERDHVVTNKNQETSLPGVFAAGDLTNNPLKQVVTAAAEGAIAANSAYKEIKEGA
jgi:thioredoxin reductase (NADPH)